VEGNSLSVMTTVVLDPRLSEDTVAMVCEEQPYRKKAPGRLFKIGFVEFGIINGKPVDIRRAVSPATLTRNIIKRLIKKNFCHTEKCNKLFWTPDGKTLFCLRRTVDDRFIEFIIYHGLRDIYSSLDHLASMFDFSIVESTVFPLLDRRQAERILNEF